MSYSSVITIAPGAIVSVMSGLIVCCLTSDNILMTTWPPRWIIPRTRGFSFSSVPRPRSPFRRRRRPGRPFFDCFGMAFVSGDNVDLIAFDRAFQLRFGLEVNDAAAQLRG